MTKIEWLDWETRYNPAASFAHVTMEAGKRCDKFVAPKENEKNYMGQPVRKATCEGCKITYTQTQRGQKYCGSAACNAHREQISEDKRQKRQRDAARASWSERRKLRADCPHTDETKAGSSKGGHPRVRCTRCGKYRFIIVQKAA